MTINFTDPANSRDTYDAHISWGDGSNSTLYAFSSGMAATHTYAAAGPYTITVSVSDEDGGTSGLATTSLVVNFSTGGILQPVNWTQGNQDPSIFKFGSTLPVKVQLFNCNSHSRVSRSYRYCQEARGSTPMSGVDEAITNTNSPDSSGVMRWSTSQYIYNLATKSLSDSSATYGLTLTVQLTGQTVSTTFGVKPK